MAAQQVTIAMEPFLDVSGGRFVRAGVHDQLRALAVQGLSLPA
ncbi:hypothetical protein [Synechococcus sp. KORDI-52]|nr:hypothetical protein [Synechococcus sp. KORDI-52]